MKKYFTYMLECADGTLYCGATSDVEKRVHQHNHAKSGAHYTKIRRPVRLVYAEECQSFAHSRRREGEIKKLSREEKIDLMGV